MTLDASRDEIMSFLLPVPDSEFHRADEGGDVSIWRRDPNAAQACIDLYMPRRFRVLRARH